MMDEMYPRVVAASGAYCVGMNLDNRGVLLVSGRRFKIRKPLRVAMNILGISFLLRTSIHFCRMGILFIR